MPTIMWAYLSEPNFTIIGSKRDVVDRTTLTLLEEALQATPENTLLRSQIATGYLNLAEYEQARPHFQELVQQRNERSDKIALANCYRHLDDTGTAMVICEELLDTGLDTETASLHVWLLVDEGNLVEAGDYYKDYQSQLDDFSDSSLEEELHVTVVEDPDEALPANLFFEDPGINFSNVGGMEQVKEEINMKIILPQKNPELFSAYGKKAGGGILLYGPPGCGKTFVSRATAGEIEARFMSIGIDTILDMYIGNSERNLHQRFEVARAHSPCVLFIDEVDALGSKRNDLKQSAGRNLINQFLKEMDGIESDNEGVLVLAATNSPWHIDPAFLRPGRFDRIVFVPPPDQDAREAILRLQLAEKPTNNIDYEKLAGKTNGFSGADLGHLVELTVEEKLRKAIRSGKVDPVTTGDLTSKVKKVRPSSKDWFATARNYALYSNSSGLYDDVAAYLKL